MSHRVAYIDLSKTIVADHVNKKFNFTILKPEWWSTRKEGTATILHHNIITLPVEKTTELLLLDGANIICMFDHA